MHMCSVIRVFVLCIWTLSIFVSYLFTYSGAAVAQTDNPSVDTTTPEPNPLIELGSDYQNSIPLLQNRFRIDYEVDEITMIFFRRFGSAPVVLVQPDGAKIFSSQTEREDVFWYDAQTYDMISIKAPTPGPWQAVGDVLPDSRIMVVSDVRLHAEPMPAIIFSGEILKQTAYLTNAGQPIDFTGFRDVVDLTIDFKSTNDPNFDNFGADTEQIARFEDTGIGMDEAPLDGVFTGQFNLGVVPGQWLPIFKVRTPLFTREQIGEPVRLLPNPIAFDYELDAEGDGYHTLLFDIDPAYQEFVDRESILIDGKVRFPNGDIQPFSLTELSNSPREQRVVNFEYGVFRVNITVFGQTVNGRDFILDVPELSFLSQAPELTQALELQTQGQQAQEPAPDEALPVNTQTEIFTSQIDASPQGQVNDDQQSISSQQSPEPKQSMSDGDVITWLLAVNAMILLGGGAIVYVAIRVKRGASDGALGQRKTDAEKNKSGASGDNASLMRKLKAMFSRS